VACDLSQTTDPCSVSCVWALGDRKFCVRSHAWVCEEGVKRREQTNLPKYRQYEADGTMTISRGTVNDYRAIKYYILSLRERFKLKEVVFDQYNALELCTQLMSEGLTVTRQPQNHRAYTAPVKELEVAINEQRIKHDGNKLLRWCLSNVRPSRDKSTDKIDAAISTLMAFGRAVEANATGAPRKSVYEDRGILLF
jgi:phage terminase large subunit-like protein